MCKRNDITFDRKTQRKIKESQKELKNLKKIKFACEEDARAALERWKRKNPYCLLKYIMIFYGFN
jgi:hypothetical protein